jgi:DNA-binding GntR family transcriptional regulator
MSTTRYTPLTKTDAAYHDLRVAIESGTHKPGSRLLIGELQDQLGMSPTPIREALRLLQRDGLVEHTPHHGTAVASFTERRTPENHRLRVELESLAAELAAERASGPELAQVSKLHAKFTRTVRDEPAGRKAPGLNLEWHMAIYAAAHSAQLLDFIEHLWRVTGATKFFSVHGERSIAEHGAVVEALVARDATGAAAMMRQHLASVDSDLEDLAPRGAPE